MLHDAPCFWRRRARHATPASRRPSWSDDHAAWGRGRPGGRDNPPEPGSRAPAGLPRTPAAPGPGRGAGGSSLRTAPPGRQCHHRAAGDVHRRRGDRPAQRRAGPRGGGPRGPQDAGRRRTWHGRSPGCCSGSRPVPARSGWPSPPRRTVRRPSYRSPGAPPTTASARTPRWSSTRSGRGWASCGSRPARVSPHRPPSAPRVPAGWSTSTRRSAVRRSGWTTCSGPSATSAPSWCRAPPCTAACAPGTSRSSHGRVVAVEDWGLGSLGSDPLIDLGGFAVRFAGNRLEDALGGRSAFGKAVRRFVTTGLDRAGLPPRMWRELLMLAQLDRAHRAATRGDADPSLLISMLVRVLPEPAARTRTRTRRGNEDTMRAIVTGAAGFIGSHLSAPPARPRGRGRGHRQPHRLLRPPAEGGEPRDARGSRGVHPAPDGPDQRAARTPLRAGRRGLPPRRPAGRARVVGQRLPALPVPQRARHPAGARGRPQRVAVEGRLRLQLVGVRRRRGVPDPRGPARRARSRRTA